MKLKVNRSFWTNGVCPELIHPRKQKLLLGSRWILQTWLSLGPITLLLFMETSEPRLSPLMEQSGGEQGGTHAERRCAKSRGSLWPETGLKAPVPTLPHCDLSFASYVITDLSYKRGKLIPALLTLSEDDIYQRTTSHKHTNTQNSRDCKKVLILNFGIFIHLRGYKTRSA